METTDDFQVEATISVTVSDNDTPTKMTTLPTKSDDSDHQNESGETTTDMLMNQMMELGDEKEKDPMEKELPSGLSVSKDSPEISEKQVKTTPLSFIRLPKLIRENSFSEKIVTSSEANEGKPTTPENDGKVAKTTPLAFIKVPKLKREKSNPEMPERKKKRVKFSTSEENDDVMVDTRVFEPIDSSHFGAADDTDIPGKIKKLLRRSKRKKSTIETQTEDEKKKCSDNVEKLDLKDDNSTSTLPSSDAQFETDNEKPNNDNDVCAHEVSSPEEDSLKVNASSSHDLFYATEHSLCVQNNASQNVVQEDTVPILELSLMTETNDENVTEWARSPNTHVNIQVDSSRTDRNECTDTISYVLPETTTLQEQQELEISTDDNKSNRNSEDSFISNDLHASFKDDQASNTPQGAVKREGTFTLDDPPPAKITKSDCDVTENAMPATDPPHRDSIMEPLQFFINLDDNNETKDSVENVEIKDETSKNLQLPKNEKIKEPIDKTLPENSESQGVILRNNAKKTFVSAWRTAVKPEISDKSPKSLVKPAVLRPKTPPAKSESSIKPKIPGKPESVLRPKTPPAKPDSPVQRSSPVKKDLSNRSSPIKQDLSNRSSPIKQDHSPRHSPTTKERTSRISNQRKVVDAKSINKSTGIERLAEPKNPKESVRLSRQPRKTPVQHPDSPRPPVARRSVWAGVSLPSFRREGTFTKKYDSEMERLKAELQKLNIEKDRLQGELCEARTRLDDEVAARKALKRNQELSIRQLREAEIKRSEHLIMDLRNRLEDEKREALQNQKVTLTRNHDTELMRAEREKDEDHRKVLHEARLTEERLKAEIRRETLRLEQQPVKTQCCHTTERDVERMNRDLATLREYKKRLEDAVQTLQETERKRAGDLRRVHEEHEAEIVRIHKINKSEAAKLLDELRSKERAISQLEKQVSFQSSKIGLLEEKTRELSNERSEDGRKQLMTRGGGSGVSNCRKQKDGSQKDGRRDKDSRSRNPSPATTITPTLPAVTITRRSLSLDVESLNPSPMEQSVESGISMTMSAEADDLRHLIEQQRHTWEDKQRLWEETQKIWEEKEKNWESSQKIWEEKQQEWEEKELEWNEKQLHFEEKEKQWEEEKQKTLQELEEERQKIDLSKQEWTEEKEQLLQAIEEQKEINETEREKWQEEIHIQHIRVEEQEQMVEAQQMVLAEQKHVMAEQQMRIVDLTEDAMDRECMALAVQPIWPARRESCVKVSELPTVIEQSSDEELSPTSSPTSPNPPAVLDFDHESYDEEEDEEEYEQSATPISVATPTSFMTPTTPGTEPFSWPQLINNEITNQYAQLVREHHELQKAYQLLVSTSTASSPSIDLGYKGGSSEWWSSAKVVELESLNSTLKAELQEARDHADLLEFRVLELTEEDSDKVSEIESSSAIKFDKSTSTELNEVILPSSQSEDLSLPLSIDSGLDISNDYKARATEGRIWLAQLAAQTNPDSPAALNLAALLDWVAAIPTHSSPHHGLSSPMSPTLSTPAPTPKAGMGQDDFGVDLGRDLILLAARLQDSLTDPTAQEAVLLDTITKLRVLDTSLSHLQEKVITLTEENRELQEAVTTLSDAHETRTEASGTESELVHRKTPSIHSDLSDAESDSPEHAQQHRPVKLVNLDASTSFQESGIFDTSCELVHVTTQTELESDEYLTSCLDERIILTKAEYDGIVESERCLQGELEHLKCEKDQLTLDCKDLREQIKLHGERLESQLDAGREMENLLSASLSQEQEISRELHKRVRDLQIMEREHRGRLEKLERISREAEEKAAALGAARDELAVQLSFAVYGLMLADNWRLMVPNPNVALVPYSGKVLKPTEFCPTISIAEEPLHTKENVSFVKDSESCTSTNRVMCDMCVQTDSGEFHVNSVATQATQVETEACSVAVQCYEDTKCDNVTEHGQRRSADKDNENEPENKRPRNTRNRSTMTHAAQLPSELEQYYLEQIETLQREKISLRKGQELVRRDSLKHNSNMEVEIKEMRQELNEAQRDNCSLIFRLEETEDQRDGIQQSYVDKIEELKGDISRYKEMYEQEKKSLLREYNERLREIQTERNIQEDRARQLEFQLSNFRQELEIIIAPNSHELAELDTDVEMISQGSQSAGKRTDDGELIKKIRDMVKAETSLRQKIYDLEKKECAYRETIREADKIMSSHMTSYKQRIEDLEATIDQQLSKIQQLEASEERLRASLRNNSRSSEGARISELLDRLIDTENSELKLKERVWTLERNEKELQIKLMEGEKNHQSLHGELRDQEDLIRRLRALETENNALSTELNQAQESSRKMSEIQQNESYLRGRVEELEVAENMLRETLQQADLILAQREKKFRDQVSSLQEEVQAYKAQLEAAASKEYGARESEVSYRKQLEELKYRLADAERELKESSSETMSHETQHRSEVTKLRNQLKLSNSQLTELDRLNCELRDRVLAAEVEGQRLVKDLEEHGRRHEQDLISFNLQISSRDSRIEEMEHQLEQMTHAHAASELDALASSPIASLHTSITALTTALKSCDTCKETQSGALTEVTAQLGTLAELLEGQTSDIEDIVSDTDEEEPHEAENLAYEATSTSPPNPAGEGPKEHSSGDVPSCSSNGRLKRDFRRRSRRRLEERNSRRLVRPQGSNTILEELEEKVRELEEAISRKEEELRLADGENCELNNQLQSRDEALSQKDEEVAYINSTLASLRQQLMLTMEDYERSKLSLQAKHKVDVEKLTQQVEKLIKEAELIACRGKLKDSIIYTLVGQIRAILRSGNMTVVINQLQRLQEVNPEDQTSNMEGSTDFDIEAVCSLLSQPNEMVSLSQSAFLSGMEPSSYVTSGSSLSYIRQQPTSNVTCIGSPSVVHQRKSRIPRYSPSSLQSTKSTSVPVDKNSSGTPFAVHEKKVRSKSLCDQNLKPASRISREKRPRLSLTSLSKLSPASAPNSVPASPSIRETSLMLAGAAVSTFQEKRPISPPKPVNTPVSEPMEVDYISETKNFKEEVPPPPQSSPQPDHRALVSSSSKFTGRKDSIRRERPTNHLSDARKVKRMVTGVAPLDAAVDCASAPEWRSRSPIGSTAGVEVTCIPRPQNLHITRRVGVDGVVIAWAPLEHDCVAGFQVLVGGRVVQHVRSPHRTKALVTGLPLAGSFTIGLVTVAEDGRCSTPVIVTQDRTRVYSSRSSSVRPLRRGVPTCL